MVEKTKAELLEEINKLKSEKVEVPANSASSFMDEMQKIAQKARVDSTTIKVQDFADHYNISLWTPLGKRIGPMHRTNAEATLRRFYSLGRPLTVEQPTPEQVEAYKETNEYKVWKKNLDASRAIKDKSRKKENLEKMIIQIAKLSGQTAEQVNQFVGNVPISQGRKMAGVDKG